MVLICHVGHAILYLLVFVVNNKASAAEKGKMPLKPANPIISLDDLLAEKIGAEGVSRVRADFQRRTQNSGNIGAQPCQGNLQYISLFC